MGAFERALLCILSAGCSILRGPSMRSVLVGHDDHLFLAVRVHSQVGVWQLFVCNAAIRAENAVSKLLVREGRAVVAIVLVEQTSHCLDAHATGDTAVWAIRDNHAEACEKFDSRNEPLS